MIQRLLALADANMIVAPLDAALHPKMPAAGEDSFLSKETAFKHSVARDEWTNAATLLDPAAFCPSLHLNLDDAVSFWEKDPCPLDEAIE